MVKGKNYSSKREAIYNSIIGTKSHPSAKWVYDSLKNDIPDLSLGTVYRNIALFKQTGAITCVATIDGEERYDGDTSCHAHFICDKCNRIYDISLDEPFEVELSLKEKGFIVNRKNVVFHGVCRDCCSK